MDRTRQEFADMHRAASPPEPPPLKWLFQQLRTSLVQAIPPYR